MHYVETVKQLDFNHYVQFTRLPTDNTPDCCARGPRLNSRLWQGFLSLCFVLLLCFFVFCVCLCFVQTHDLLVRRLLGYQDTDLAYLTYTMYDVNVCLLCLVLFCFHICRLFWWSPFCLTTLQLYRGGFVCNNISLNISSIYL